MSNFWFERTTQEEPPEAPPSNLKMNTRGSNGASTRHMMGQLLATNGKYKRRTQLIHRGTRRSKIQFLLTLLTKSTWTFHWQYGQEGQLTLWLLDISSQIVSESSWVYVLCSYSLHLCLVEVQTFECLSDSRSQPEVQVWVKVSKNWSNK